MGHHVTLIGRTEKKLEKVAQSFASSNYLIYPLDVAASSKVKEVFAKIEQDVKPIDILINNAGLGYFDLVENITDDQVHQMIDINLKGTIFCTQAVLSSMKERDAGSVINIVSTAGVEGKVEESVYCASKFGARGFTESLQKELMNPDDVADLVIFNTQERTNMSVPKIIIENH